MSTLVPRGKSSIDDVSLERRRPRCRQGRGVPVGVSDIYTHPDTLLTRWTPHARAATRPRNGLVSECDRPICYECMALPRSDRCPASGKPQGMKKVTAPAQRVVTGVGASHHDHDRADRELHRCRPSRDRRLPRTAGSSSTGRRIRRSPRTAPRRPRRVVATVTSMFLHVGFFTSP